MFSREVVSLSHEKEADSFSVYRKESVSPPDAEETDSSLSLYIYIYTYISIYIYIYCIGSFSFLIVEEADFFGVQRRECLYSL